MKKLYEEFKEYETMWELLEWVDSKGTQVSTPAAQTQTNSTGSSTLLTIRERFQKILDQIAADKTSSKYKVIDLSDRVLYVQIIFNSDEHLMVRIIYNTRKQNFTLQLNGDLSDEANKGDHHDLSWKEVLDYLVAEGVVTNTNLCK